MKMSLERNQRPIAIIGAMKPLRRHKYLMFNDPDGSILSATPSASTIKILGIATSIPAEARA